MRNAWGFLREIVRAAGVLPFLGKSCFHLACYLIYFTQPILIQTVLAANSTREVLIALAALALSLLMPSIIDLTNNRTMQDFRRYSKGLVFKRLLERDYAYYQERSSSEIQSYLNEISFACRNLEDRYAHTVLRMTAMGLLYVVSLCMQNALLGLAYAVFLAVYIVVSAKLSSRGRKGVGESLAATASVNAGISDSIGNISSVYSLGAQRHEEERTWGALDYEAVQYRSVQGRSNRVVLIQEVMVVGFAAILLLLAMGQQVSVATTLLTLLYSILNLTGFGAQYLLICEFSDRLNVALKALDLDRPRGDFTDVRYDARAKSLELRGIEYSYPHSERRLLCGKSASFKKGEVTAIVGPNGSGKSTLLKVIAGLLAPQAGHILVPYDADCKVMLVGQGVTLFNRSLAENLFYPEATGDVDRAMELVEEIDLGSAIASREQLFALKPGDLAGKVSGGELQKVQIVRAILYKPDILLCDEITSGLDVKSVETFYGMLRRYLPGTTVVGVVHRKGELEFFDEVVGI